MTDGGKEPASVGHPDDDRHVRAAQVLAAVVGGLTSTPEELSSKHRANRSAGASGTGTGAGATPSTVAAKPALQKIRDYQLQVRSPRTVFVLVFSKRIPERVWRWCALGIFVHDKRCVMFSYLLWDRALSAGP